MHHLQRHSSRKTSRQAIVERAEAYLRAHQCSPMRLAQLCRIVGLSERGLREAFYDVRGMSPKQYMLRERLHCARRALRCGGAGRTTVTSVAADHGFFELGRFAGAYKAMFGEAPSETLRGTGPERSNSMNGEREGGR